MGDAAYAKFSNQKLTQYRVVHNKDLVPHNPTMDWPLNFHHSFYEEFEDGNGFVKQCDVSGEDPTCSNKFNPLLLNVFDHLKYLGRCMGVECLDCGNWSSVATASAKESDAFAF